MTTWAQVQHFARQKYELRRDDGSQLVVVVPLGGAADRRAAADTAADTRAELVHAQTLTEFGEPWLLLRVAVCGERLLDIPAALKRSAQQVLGALVLSDHLLTLRHGMPLETVRPEDLERTLQFLAHTAAYFREQLRAPYDRAEADENEEASTPQPGSGKAILSLWGD